MPGADAHRRVSCRALQVLHQPLRTRRHAQVSSGWVDAVRAQQFYKKIPPIPRDPRRRVGAPPPAKGETDHRPSIGPWQGWGYRGDVRDALDWVLPSVVGTADEPAAHTPADLALLGWHSEPTPSNKPPISSDAYWSCTTGAFPCKRRTFLAPGYGCVPRANWLRHYSTTVLPNGAQFFCTKPMTASGGLGKSALAHPPTGNILYVF